VPAAQAQEQEAIGEGLPRPHGMTAGAAAGYRQVAAGRCKVVTREEFADDALQLLNAGSLYEGARHSVGASELHGRGIAYRIALPVSGVPVVVRHNRHGGLFAPLTRDLFLPPTRAPYELLTARQLQTAGVRTPDVLMIGVAPALGVFRQSDVVTREIAGRDLSFYMQPAQREQRAAAWKAARELVRSLNAAGARHFDLNVKNILLEPNDSGFVAWVLDVDRVVFAEPNASGIANGNYTRLRRSARKWRDERGAEFEDSDLVARD
jgi:hypothetical protein